ncbi:hypothetical protein FRX31_032361 [Thalictrum thalictroides]|uniref:Ubiquitin-like domain-containing protein n=1 Tax=Thalictrum thalictroides TaxID=46969 RepID=A0A7J6UZI2_THATH|nr:hypothetical protein FRX31_032361 [Thalictrum thalictroides]
MSGEENITIFIIDTEEDKPYRLVVSKDYTIYEIKEELYRLCGIHMNYQVLLHDDLELVDGFDLLLYGILKNDTQLYLKKLSTWSSSSSDKSESRSQLSDSENSSQESSSS